MNNNIILGIDQANHFGWAVFDNQGYHLSDHLVAEDIYEFSVMIKNLVRLYNPTVILCESPILVSKRGTVNFQRSCEKIGIVKCIAIANEIEFAEVHHSTAKSKMGVKASDAKAKGVTVKELMIDAVNLKFELEIEDDNESDAVALTFAYVQNS